MKTAFIDLPRPFVCALIEEKSISETLTRIRQSDFAGAHAVGVDIRSLPAEDKTVEKLTQIINSTVRPIYGMHYRKDGDGLTDDDRAGYLVNFAKAGASVIDVMGDFFDRSELEITHSKKAITKQKALIKRIHEAGGSVLMSSHIQAPRTTEQVYEHLKEFDHRGADILKIVTTVNTEEEMIESIRTTMFLNRNLAKPFIHVTNGRYGRHQRTIAPMFGCMLSFSGIKSEGPALSPWFPVETLRKIADTVYEHMDTDIK